MRRRALILIALCFVLSGAITTACAADAEAYNAAGVLYDLGLFSGTGTKADGSPNFDLDRTPTRHEAVTMLVSLLGKKDEALSKTWDTPFTDVADWAKPFVGYAYANGLTSGTSATTYSGNAPLTAAQYFTFVLKALGYETGVDFQWDKSFEFAAQIGLTDNRYATARDFLRGDVTIVSRNAMDIRLKDSQQTLAEKLIEEKVFTKTAYNNAVAPLPKGDSAIELTDEVLATLAKRGDLKEISRTISTAEDTIRLISVAGIKEGRGDTIKSAFTEKTLRPDLIIELAVQILFGDYEELGMVTISPEYYVFLYVKQDGVYSIYDVLKSTYVGTDVKAVTFDSGDAMIDYAVKNRNGTSGQITICPSSAVTAPNGDKLPLTSNFGTPTFQYADTTIPVGLGLPELSDEEIDALLAENDPRKVKDTLTTLADFVNYCYRGNFLFGDGLICLYESSGRSVQTTCSGYQTLQRRIGQCASMSSCLHYVLDGDYEEVAYVMVDEHLMAYIRCNGLYYLVNPVEYVTTMYENNRRTSSWLDDIAHGSNGTFCSVDFQDIADSLYGSPIGPGTITHVYTYTGPGDFLRIGFANFPKGSKAIRWYGPEPVGYASYTQYDWLSQENVVDENAIVMYPSPNRKVNFGGIHEDPYTGEQY